MLRRLEMTFIEPFSQEIGKMRLSAKSLESLQPNLCFLAKLKIFICIIEVVLFGKVR